MEQEGWEVGEQEKLGAGEATADRTCLPPSHNTHGWAQKLAQGRSCHAVSTGPGGSCLPWLLNAVSFSRSSFRLWTPLQ